MERKDLIVTSTLTGKRQITIPKELTDHLGLDIGDKVVFRERGGEVIFEKANKTTVLNFIIPFTQLSDWKKLNDFVLIKEIFDIAEDIIARGGQVTLQREYKNAPPEVLGIYVEQKKFAEFKERFLAL